MFHENINANAFVWHSAKLDYIALAGKLADLLPHGSGIDCDWTLDVKRGKVVASNSYHAMDEWGSYDGWADFYIAVPTKSPKDFAFHFHGKLAQYLNRKYALREYLEDEMYCALEELWKETR